MGLLRFTRRTTGLFQNGTIPSEAGAYVNMTDSNWFPPNLYAVRQDNPKMARYLC